jgi:hypothetical protein
MLGDVEQRKPAAIRRCATIDSFNDDLDCLITGLDFHSDLSVFEIYFEPTTIAAADDGVGM